MERPLRIALTLAAVAVTVLGVVPATPARAAVSSAQISAQIRALNAEVAQAGKAYEQAEFALEDTTYQIRQNTRRMVATSKDLAAARKKLRARAADIYRIGRIDVLSILFESSSLDDLMTRMTFVEAIAGQDAATVGDVKDLGARLGRQRATLVTDRARVKSIVSGRAARVAVLQASLRSKQADYARLKAQLAAAAASERAAGHLAPTAVGKGANGMVFPVAGPEYYSDTWGAARSGGRTHKGTDIMAARGVPVVAVVDGTVSSKEGGLGGKVIWLSGSGWSFYYAHLDGWKVRGGSVKAGQVIGWVGATGNAAGGSPHLHFEMHPGGGAAVDPYPYLRAMQ